MRGDGRSPWRGRGESLAMKFPAKRVRAVYRQKVSSPPPELEASPHLVDGKTKAREAESVLSEAVMPLG